MKKVQNLNRNKHQNLNNLFYDIGWRVSKYVDGLQQIVPAAKQLETVRRHRALTQLVQASPVPLESPNVVVLPQTLSRATRKAIIVPELCVCCTRALALIWRSVTHALAPRPLTHIPGHSKPSMRIGRCCS